MRIRGPVCGGRPEPDIRGLLRHGIQLLFMVRIRIPKRIRRPVSILRMLSIHGKISAGERSLSSGVAPSFPPKGQSGLEKTAIVKEGNAAFLPQHHTPPSPESRNGPPITDCRFAPGDTLSPRCHPERSVGSFNDRKRSRRASNIIRASEPNQLGTLYPAQNHCCGVRRQTDSPRTKKARRASIIFHLPFSIFHSPVNASLSRLSHPTP